MENTSMQSSGGKAVTKVRPLEITSDRMQEVFTDAFRAEVGRGKVWSRDSLAHATGFDTSSIGSWMNGEAVPTAWKLVRLMAVLGPAFSNRILTLAGQTGADWVDGELVTILEVNAAATALAAKVAHDLQDGVVDEAEAAGQDALAQRLHELTGDYLTHRRQRRGARITVPGRLRVV